MVLPYINMNPPRVYTCSPSWNPSYLPPRTIPLSHPSAPAPSILYPASNLDWRFISYMILHMFQCHSPKSHLPPSPTESKRLFNTSVPLFLSCIQGYRYLLSKFHIFAFSSIQFSHSVMSDSLQPQACWASLSITNSRSSLKLMSIE